jgi:hypothetical protein
MASRAWAEVNASDARPSWRRAAFGLLVLLAVFAAGLAVGEIVGGKTDGGENGYSPPTAGRLASGGPTGILKGVPVGYAHSRIGAVAAARHFLAVEGSRLVGEEVSYVAAMRTMSAPEWEARAADIARNATEFVTNRYGLDVDVRTVPVGYRIRSFDGDTASLDVWVVTIASGNERPVGEQIWDVHSIQLRWIDGDWRLSSQESQGGAAPAFLPGQSSADVSTVVKEFRDYGFTTAP